MELRNKIIALALPLFLKNGIRSMTMSDIANELGMSKRTLYEAFRDKDELLEACLTLHNEQMDLEIEDMKIHSDNIIDLFIHIYGQYLHRMNDINPYMIRDLKKYYPAIYEKIHQRQEASYNIFIPLLNQGVQEGLIRKELHFEILLFLIKAQFNSLIGEKLPNTQYSPHEFIRTILLHFMRGIATPAGNEMIDKFIEKTENSN
ncbi:MAG: TetR/AcrR family transcriptional regulator [Candidatus Symbiothrix sp.]|jgi:AcrR family transcriptional regulator|nr:TetR/AcrR family transcriptional regulator [Candidatus Symbiothrix sp.]